MLDSRPAHFCTVTSTEAAHTVSICVIYAWQQEMGNPSGGIDARIAELTIAPVTMQVVVVHQGAIRNGFATRDDTPRVHV